jgi:endonuclease-8
MPEGPSIVILKELVAGFKGKNVIAVSGNSKIEKQRALDQRVIDFRSWGKHFLICFRQFTIKVHFLLFGSYRINEERDLQPRLSLKFKSGVINFYACSVKILNDDLDAIYDWSADVMSDSWHADAARKKLQAQPKSLVCDCLLDQDVFAGSGNIIKNEVLFRIRVHPLSIVDALSARKRTEMINAVRDYSFEFLEWKKAYVLRKHWLVHTKQICPRCEIPLVKGKLGNYQRRTFFCAKCQKLYSGE